MKEKLRVLCPELFRCCFRMGKICCTFFRLILKQVVVKVRKFLKAILFVQMISSRDKKM